MVPKYDKNLHLALKISINIVDPSIRDHFSMGGGGDERDVMGWMGKGRSVLWE